MGTVEQGWFDISPIDSIYEIQQNTATGARRSRIRQLQNEKLNEEWNDGVPASEVPKISQNGWQSIALSSGNPDTAIPEPLLQFFEYSHLKEPLASVSAKFYNLAHDMVMLLPRNPERSVALRKLLEAKDCAVRARMMKL